MPCTHAPSRHVAIASPLSPTSVEKYSSFTLKTSPRLSVFGKKSGVPSAYVNERTPLVAIAPTASAAHSGELLAGEAYGQQVEMELKVQPHQPNSSSHHPNDTLMAVEMELKVHHSSP